jgi:hypothetical protein
LGGELRIRVTFFAAKTASGDAPRARGRRNNQEHRVRDPAPRVIL